MHSRNNMQFRPGSDTAGVGTRHHTDAWLRRQAARGSRSRGGGRPSLFDRPMTAAERKRRQRMSRNNQYWQGPSSGLFVRAMTPAGAKTAGESLGRK